MFGRIHQWIHLDLMFSVLEVYYIDKILNRYRPVQIVCFSCVNFGRFCFSRAWSFSFRLSNLWAWSYSYHLLIIPLKSRGSVVMPSFIFDVSNLCFLFSSLGLLEAYWFSLLISSFQFHWFLLKFLFLFFFLNLFCFGCAGSSLWYKGFSLQWLLSLQSVGSRHKTLVVAPQGLGFVAQGLSCFAACEIFPDQGSNPYSLHWQMGSFF